MNPYIFAAWINDDSVERDNKFSFLCLMDQLSGFSNVIVESPLSTAGDDFSVIEYNGADTQYYAICKEGNTVFAGHTTDSALTGWVMGEIPQRLLELSASAINNRTRERNFFRLSEQLSSGEISEDEYERELDEREDEYVIKCNVRPSVLDLKIAASLAPHLMDVEDTDDLAVLFSFEEAAIRRYLGE